MTATNVSVELAARWSELKKEKPKLRIRDAAEELGVSEAELVALGCGKGTTRLQNSMKEILKRVPELGQVMALTRNASAVHEKRGTYANVQVDESPVGLVLDPAIDLRVFFMNIHLAFAVREDQGEKTRRSLQFFDKDGNAVHKIYLENDAGIEAFENIASDFTSEDQSRVQQVSPKPPPPSERPDSEVDVEALRNDWRALQDTHDFFGLLRKHKVTRTQAMRLVGSEFARKAPASSLRTTLEKASATKVPIMVFVGSPGVIQIHSGPVKEVRVLGPWANVLDKDFNLHLREDHISEAWIVRKPTRDGDVTALELFDAKGSEIALLFGERKPGKPELQEWRSLVSSLEVHSDAN